MSARSGRGARAPVVLLATDSRDRGAGSRLLESLVAGLPALGFTPAVTVGGEGPLAEALLASGVTPAIVPLRVVPYRSWPVPFALAVLRLARVIAGSGARLVHVNEHESFPLVARAARLAGVPVVCHVRFGIEEAYGRWLFAPSRLPVRLIFNSHTLQRACEGALRDVVPRERWRVVHNGIDFERFGLDADARGRLRHAWGLGPDTIVFGSACAISPRKRVDHFVRLVMRLVAQGADVVGFHAGRPHFPTDRAIEDALHAQVRASGDADRFRFLGYVEPVEPLYHAWDVVVSTSDRESFGMTMLEAMACGCAVLGYPAESLPEVVGEAGVLVPEGDEDALLAGGERLVRDAAWRQDLASRGRRRAQDLFDVRRSVERLAEEYQAVLHGTGDR